MKRDILERPFEAALVESRRGAFGKTLSYVEGTEYIRRLNDAFDGEWSFEIVAHDVRGNEVVVIGKLSAGPVVKTAFGGSAITTSTQTGEVISLADDIKAAATDSLKKAASLLGVGLHLYSDPRDDAEASGVHPISPAPGDQPVGEGKSPAPNPPTKSARPSVPLTERQLNAIIAVGRQLKLSKDEIERRCKDRFGVSTSDLSKRDASAFISSLLESTKKSA